MDTSEEVTQGREELINRYQTGTELHRQWRQAVFLPGCHGDRRHTGVPPIWFATRFPLMPRCHVHMPAPIWMPCLRGGAADLMLAACLWKGGGQVGGQMAKQTGRQSAVAIGLAYGSNCILRKQKGHEREN